MTRTVQLFTVTIPKDQFPVDNLMSVYDMNFLSKFWDSLSALSVESDEFDAGLLSNIGITKPKAIDEGYRVGILCFTDFASKVYEPIRPLAHLSWDSINMLANKVPLSFNLHKLRQDYASPLNWLMLTQTGLESALEKENY